MAAKPQAIRRIPVIGVCNVRIHLSRQSLVRLPHLLQRGSIRHFGIAASGPHGRTAERDGGGELDLAAATARLKTALVSVVTAFEELRKERLRSAPLDEDRMGLVRLRMSEAVMAYGPSLTCFRNYDIQRDTSGTIPAIETEFGVMDKGLFTLPEMSAASFDDVPSIFVEILRTHLSNLVWQDLYHRFKRVIPVDISAGTDPFWQRVIAEAPSVGPEPMVLVPFAGIGEEIAMASTLGGGPAGLNVNRDAAMPSGGGTGYMGTVEGIPVYSAQVLTQQAILCSGCLLRAITTASSMAGTTSPISFLSMAPILKRAEFD
jgi:hypothetical protein